MFHNAGFCTPVFDQQPPLKKIINTEWIRAPNLPSAVMGIVLTSPTVITLQMINPELCNGHLPRSRRKVTRVCASQVLTAYAFGNSRVSKLVVMGRRVGLSLRGYFALGIRALLRLPCSGGTSGSLYDGRDSEAARGRFGRSP